MTKIEICEHSLEIVRLLHIRRAEAIQHLCDIGASLDLARRIWLYSVASELHAMGEYWSIPRTASYSEIFCESRPENQEDLFNV